MPTEFTLRILDDFTCLGNHCPDNCCDVGWEVTIDRPIYDKWLALPESEDKQRMLQSVVIGNDTQHILLKKDNNKKCPHLAEDGLCLIHARHGPDYLGTICREYPRVCRERGTTRVKTASLSCPEIARQVLSAGNDQALFRRSPEQATHHNVTLDHPWTPDGISDALDDWTGQVLAQRKFPLNIRLYYLSDVLCQLAELAQEGRADMTSITRLCGQYKRKLYDTNLAVKQHRLAVDPVIAGSFWQFIYQAGQQLYTAKQYENIKDSPLLKTLSNGNAHDTAHYKSLYELIQQHRNQARTIIHAFDTAFENYILALFRYNGFPWHPTSGNYVATFIRCLIPFALTQLTLWMTAAETGQLNEEDIHNTVYRVERTVGHGPGIYEELERNQSLLRLDHYAHTLVEIY